MSELLDKHVNVQKESLKKTSGVHASSRKPTKKVCDENERKRKKEKMAKIFCGERKDFIKLYIKRMAEPMSMNFGLLILQTVKVLIL